MQIWSTQTFPLVSLSTAVPMYDSLPHVLLWYIFLRDNSSDKFCKMNLTLWRWNEFRMIYIICICIIHYTFFNNNSTDELRKVKVT